MAPIKNAYCRSVISRAIPILVDERKYTDLPIVILLQNPIVNDKLQGRSLDIIEEIAKSLEATNGNIYDRVKFRKSILESLNCVVVITEGIWEYLEEQKIEESSMIQTREERRKKVADLWKKIQEKKFY